MHPMTSDADVATWSLPADDDGQEPVRSCVLIANEDRDTLAVLTRGLRSAGFVVIAVGSGARVLDYMRRCVAFGGRFLAPDVIIAEAKMFGCSGFDLLEALRAARCSVPIILMTARGDQQIRERAIRLGATATCDESAGAEEMAMAVLWASDSASVRYARAGDSTKRRHRSTLGYGEGLRDRDSEGVEHSLPGAGRSQGGEEADDRPPYLLFHHGRSK